MGQLLNFISVTFAIILFAYVGYYLYLYILRKRSAKLVDSEDLQANIRRVQIVDVREEAEFEAKHILGARNIPISQFNVRHTELRKDKPIYLYDDVLNFASRAANTLRKAGYREIYILRGGFSSWTGKTKSTKR